MDLIGLTQYSHLWLFFVLVLGIIAVPGMDMAYVMASAITGGRRLGLVAVFGIIVGGAVHVLMAFLGLGLLLKTVPGAYQVMLLVGAIYLAWIGLQIFRGAEALGEIIPSRVTSPGTTFGRAVITCLLNPKAYIFMLAVFPQFVRPEYGSLPVQASIMGLIIVLTQGAIYGGAALFAACARETLSDHQTLQVRIGQIFGLFLMGAAIWAAMDGLQGFEF